MTENRQRLGGGSRRPLVVLCRVALALLLCVLGTRPEQSDAAGDCQHADNVTVQLRWLRNGQFAGYYAAQGMGYFSEECLNVTLLQRQGGPIAEDAVINGRADFATAWATSDLLYREANQTSYKTIAQIFRRQGLGALASHLYIPNNISTLEDLKAEAEALGRQVKIAVTDDSVYALGARLADLGISTCGEFTSILKGDPSCSQEDHVELIARDLNGLRNIKVDQSDPAFADLSIEHVTDLSDVLRAKADDGQMVASTDRVKLLKLGGPSILEDAVAVSEDWLNEPGNTDVARRFLRATFKGWMLCRDSPRTCAETAFPEAGQAQMEFLFQITEVNKLIWPSANGIGKVMEEEFQQMYDYMADTGLAGTAHNASDGLVAGIVDGVLAGLAAEGHDIYGFYYAGEGFQQTLTFCPDSNGQPVLCAMRCAPGTEPPPGGEIFLESDCLVCQAGTASPGATEPCLQCPQGEEATGPGMAQCLARPSAVIPFSVGLGCAGLVIGLLAFAGVMLWRRSASLSKELQAMHNGAGLHVDSPLVQTLNFLGEVATGTRGIKPWRPWGKSHLQQRAQELRLTLLRSNDVTVPDIENAMQKEDFPQDIMDFVMQNAVKRSDRQPGLGSGGSNGSNGSMSTRGFKPSEQPEEANDNGSSSNDKMPSCFSRLGEDFSTDVLSWVQARPCGLLGQVLVHFVLEWRLTDTLRISVSDLERYALVIESGHASNPYHCLGHSIDVTVRLGTMLNKSGLASFLANENAHSRVVLLGAILSAVVHDYKHLGYSNKLLVEDESDVALRFNDQSCLENLALVEALEVMRSKEFGFTRSLRRSQQKQLRHVVITMVLATDMGKHFTVVTAFQAKVLDQIVSSSSRPAAYALIDSEQLLILLQIMLKCADLGHCALPWEIHLKWLNRLQEEMFSQGDVEKKKFLPVSPLADRSKPGAMWGGNQVGFLKALVLPLYKMMVLAAPGCQAMLDGVHSNLEMWEMNPEGPPLAQLQALKTDVATWDSEGLSAGSRSLAHVEDDVFPGLLLPGSTQAQPAPQPMPATLQQAVFSDGEDETEPLVSPEQ